MKYDLKGHIRSNKAFYIYLFSLNNYSIKPTLPQIVFALLSPIPTKREGTVPYLLFVCGDEN